MVDIKLERRVMGRFAEWLGGVRQKISHLAENSISGKRMIYVFDVARYLAGHNDFPPIVET